MSQRSKQSAGHHLQPTSTRHPQAPQMPMAAASSRGAPVSGQEDPGGPQGSPPLVTSVRSAASPTSHHVTGVFGPGTEGRLCPTSLKVKTRVWVFTPSWKNGDDPSEQSRATTGSHFLRYSFSGSCVACGIRVSGAPAVCLAQWAPDGMVGPPPTPQPDTTWNTALASPLLPSVVWLLFFF